MKMVHAANAVVKMTVLMKNVTFIQTVLTEKAAITKRVLVNKPVDIMEIATA